MCINFKNEILNHSYIPKYKNNRLLYDIRFETSKSRDIDAVYSQIHTCI